MTLFECGTYGVSMRPNEFAKCEIHILLRKIAGFHKSQSDTIVCRFVLLFVREQNLNRNNLDVE